MHDLSVGLSQELCTDWGDCFAALAMTRVKSRNDDGRTYKKKVSPWLTMASRCCLGSSVDRPLIVGTGLVVQCYDT